MTANTTEGPSADVQREMYRRMVRIRTFEETVCEMFRKGEMPGFLHISSGQESTAVGACLALRPDDWIGSNHRGHGHCIAKGVDVRGMMAELFGKRTGTCKGKGGSMHIADLDVGMLGANGIVGAAIPIAVGSAFAWKRLHKDRVTLCFFGEGATSEGAFHEAMNLAALLDLPIVFFCENNLYAEMTPWQVHMKRPDVAERAAAYGMPGVGIDGNDVLAVFAAVAAAAATARSGRGPTLIEAKTYRFHGHYEGDPESYRTREEVEESRARDPLRRFAAHLIEKGYCTREELGTIDRTTTEEIQEAVTFAKQSPLPEPEETLEDVYA
jgi:TPP-dependent pyruvate/acetoin dehydrogenase alpha subunit